MKIAYCSILFFKGHYRDEFLLLREIWVLLNEISVSSTEEEKDDSVSVEYIV